MQNFFVNDKELELIHLKMQAAGIQNKSAYYRKMVLQGFVIHYDLEGLQNLIYEFNKIGNNLNQLAKHANLYGEIPPIEFDALQSKIAKVVNHYCNNIPGTAVRPKRTNPGADDT